LGENEGAMLIFGGAADDHLLAETGGDGDARGDARAHLVQVTRVGEERSSGPKNVGGGRVGVALKREREREVSDALPTPKLRGAAHLSRIEKEVGDAPAVDMVVLRDTPVNIGEGREGQLARGAPYWRRR
jgi:hypothetical protein